MTQHEITSGFVDVNGMALYYEMQGEGAPVVFIHGGNLDRRMWDHQFALAADAGYTAIRYDVRLFGKSETPTAPYSDVLDLRGLLDHLGLTSATIIGLSVGGLIGIDFAVTFPERVRQLVLLGPGLSGWQWSDDIQASVAELYELASTRSVIDAAEGWLAHPFMRPAMEQPAIASWVKQMAIDNAAIWAGSDFYGDPIAPPAVDRLGELRMPVLLVTGQQDVPDVQAIADTLAARIHGCTQVRIPNTGHLVSLEAPDEFNRMMLDVLRKHGG
jgi:3-oxoadipate enol-lactonase